MNKVWQDDAWEESGNLAKYWSRRIDDKNRIVYKVENNQVIIIQCGSHYRDK